MSLLYLVVGAAFIAYPFVVWRDFGEGVGAILGVVIGGLWVLSGLVLLIPGGGGVARAIRRHRSREPSK